MYEAEANIATESLDQLPLHAPSEFGGLQNSVLTRTVLPWSEHCTECVWPTCYSTCDLYSPRKDGRCRRFVDGMVRIDCPFALNGYLIKIRFKQWGKLWTPGNIHLRSVNSAGRIESLDRHLGNTLYRLPLPSPLTSGIVARQYGLKKRLALRASHSLEHPTSFLIECFNPARCTIPLTITFRSFRQEDRIPFQKLIPLAPGFRRIRISYEEISSVVNLSTPFHIEMLPGSEAGETTLYFGLMDFVQEIESPAADCKPIKCVVWDLDNTMWDGILSEDGASALRLKPGIVEIMETLDRRGILQSIASKNNHEHAMQILRHFHLDHLFLYPQISWSPKGDAIQSIARHLNIGADSILFVDDSEFELQQVHASCPAVQIFNATEYDSIVNLRALQVDVTPESINRRNMYQVDRDRKEVAATFRDDYKAFLRHCDIKTTITCLTPENLERVHELTQRTNQMNFSGTRYDRELLRAMLVEPHLDTYVLSCEDRFGSYGIVGFGVVDHREPRLTDLMFSCRIHSKRIEHAFLVTILNHYIRLLGRDFHANYRKTQRNEAAGQVFADIGMQEIGVRDGITSLVFPRERKPLDDGIVTVLNLNNHVLEEQV